MGHAADFTAAGAPLLFKHFAESGRVTWTPKGGSAAAVSAIVGQETHTEDTGATGRRRVMRRRLTIATDPAGDYGGVAAPALNATVTVDGVTYAVESIQPRAGDYFDATVARSEAMEVSRGNYRQPLYGQPANL